MRITLFKCLVIFIYNIGIAHADNRAIKLSFCFEAWQPFAYLNKQGEAVGEHIAFLKSVLEPYGSQLSFHDMPFRRCLKEVKQGHIDFIMHVDETDGVQLIDHPMGYWELLLAYKDKSSRRKIENKDSKILVSRDYAYPKPVIDKLDSMSVQIVTESFYTNTPYEVKKLFKLVESGFVDAILVDKAWAKYELSKQEINVVLDDQLFYSQPYYFGYVKGNEEKANFLLSVLLSVKGTKKEVPHTSNNTY
jgi:ABC-type amino acid transport substrate-binding protein